MTAWRQMVTSGGLTVLLFTSGEFGDSQVVAALCGGTGNPGGTTCVPPNDVNHVFVFTSNSAGSQTGRGFWLASIP